METVAYGLGILPDAFWRMIPSEFVKYAEARYEMKRTEEKANYQRSALIATTVANFAMTKKKGKTYRIEDFMPKNKQSSKEMYQTVVRLNALFGGIDKRKKRGD